jgi:hypothetical protein
MAQAGGGGGGPPQPQAPTPGGQAGGPPTTPPQAAPMGKPQEKKGLKAAAATNVHIAVNMLEEALPAFGSESAEGGKILAALKSLSGLVAKRDSSDLVPAEVLSMFRNLPQMGGGTDVQKMIQQQMAQAGAKPQQPAAAGA